MSVFVKARQAKAKELRLIQEIENLHEFLDYRSISVEALITEAKKALDLFQKENRELLDF